MAFSIKQGPLRLQETEERVMKGSEEYHEKESKAQNKTHRHGVCPSIDFHPYPAWMKEGSEGKRGCLQDGLIRQQERNEENADRAKVERATEVRHCSFLTICTYLSLGR